MALAGVVIARSAFQAPSILPVDEKALREYTGVYQWGPDAFVYLQIWNESTGTNQLVAFDESGDIRTLYATERDRFFAGPGMAVATSIESRVEFQRDAGGAITGLTWQRDGAPPRTARRAAIERHEDGTLLERRPSAGGHAYRPGDGRETSGDRPRLMARDRRIARSVSAALLEEYRDTIVSARGSAADLWYVRQVASFLWRASRAWGAILGGALIIRYLFDTLVPVTDYLVRARILTYTIMAGCVLAGFSTAWRARSVRAGMVASFTAATIGALVSIAGTAVMLAVWHDPATLRSGRTLVASTRRLSTCR